MKAKDRFMPSREVKVFLQLIEKQFGAVPKEFKELALAKAKDRVYAVTRDVDRIDLDRVRINSLGIYVAEVKDGVLRLSIEGSQLVGPVAKKNVAEVDSDQVRAWFKGEDILVSGLFDGFVIVKYGDDFVGSGRFSDGKIVNFVPKARRLLEMH
ncbi:hypothetical protein HY489_01460 [Candidatus Woesearchaeota archaeon]|nr:hypothetical protein [Candidatus Woesearchaeota archaeon]